MFLERAIYGRSAALMTAAAVGTGSHAGGSLSRTFGKMSAGPRLRTGIGGRHNLDRRCGTSH